MALHRALPVAAAVQVRVLRFAADGGGVEQHLGALQRHRPRAFRKPLVPADRRAEPAEAGVEDLEAGVAGVEVELLLIARPVGDVALAVEPEHAAVGVDHGERVVVGVVRPLEEAHRQHHAELGGELAHPRDDGMALVGPGEREELLLLVGAEIGRLEELLQEHEVGAAARRLAHEVLGAGNVRLGVPVAGHLRGRQRHRCHPLPLVPLSRNARDTALRAPAPVG